MTLAIRQTGQPLLHQSPRRHAPRHLTPKRFPIIVTHRLGREHSGIGFDYALKRIDLTL
jgi:hypothetical protein